jgi:hypothetical protein
VNGQRVPAWRYQGRLIDGRTRARACKELGRDLLVRDWDGQGSLLAFVVSLNLRRRHLSESQRAVLGARLKPLFEEEARQRMLTGKAIDPMADLPQGPARDQAAAAVGVSGRTVEAASKVLKRGTPELIRSVETGQVSVSAAADLAGLPPDEQRDVVARGKKAAAGTAKQLRGRKARRRPAKKAAAPEPGTGNRPPSGARSADRGGEVQAATAEPGGLVISKSDEVVTIARALIDYLGEERAAQVGELLRERTQPPAEAAAGGTPGWRDDAQSPPVPTEASGVTDMGLEQQRSV